MVGRVLLGVTGFAAGVALAVTLSARKQLQQERAQTLEQRFGGAASSTGIDAGRR